VEVLESLPLESFNESLNPQTLYIPTSNHPLERSTVYSDALAKGYGLICQLESPNEPPQSPYTTIEHLRASGWNQYIMAGLSRHRLGILQPAFNELGIVYNPRDNAEILWINNLPSQNAQHKTAPVCFYRLY
jgi:hypothetical protein